VTYERQTVTKGLRKLHYAAFRVLCLSPSGIRAMKFKEEKMVEACGT
jgi:hypothetical protein